MLFRSSPIRLVSNSFIPVGRKPPRPPATHHIAALTVRPPVHGVEMLAPQLGPARGTHKASHVEDAIQGHDPGPVPDHVFSAATAPAWGAARDRVNPLTGLEACPGKPCPSDSAVPPPGGRGVSSPKYSPLGGWFVSCTSFLVSLSSSSSGGWLGGTWTRTRLLFRLHGQRPPRPPP